jgi:Pvc16 N-terminal domain
MNPRQCRSTEGIRKTNEAMDLIRTVLEQIQRYLNDFFRNTDQREEYWVILSNVMDHEGRMFEDTKDKIVMFLANITHETVISTNKSPIRTSNSSFVSAQPALYIDLFILFFANFYDRNYSEGLGMISRTISFFQQNPVFTRNNMPQLDPRIDKITMEITNLDLLEVNYLMGMLGTKYLPSVYYKLRMIPFASDAIVAAVPAARGTDTPAAPAPPNEQSGTRNG